jgi:glycosyltransferase involved in cell wall biosynthesis
MLSILLPVYNISAEPLVNALLEQARRLSVPFEILILDDASPDRQSVIENEKMAENPEVTFLCNETNCGRSFTRNRLADTAQYPYLLFIDGDAGIRSHDYLEQYISHARMRHSDTSERFVTMGGVSYHETPPEKAYRLRWHYGINREQKSAAQRLQHPYRSFTPFNMLVSKAVFNICRFDESFKTYGFEDVFFGEQLRSNGIPVEHIDNGIYHDGLDQNEVFLSKTETAVANLAQLLNEQKATPDFIRENRLLHTFLKLSDWHLSRPAELFLNINRRTLKKLVLQRYNLRALDLYKLLCLFQDTREEHSKERTEQ